MKARHLLFLLLVFNFSSFGQTSWNGTSWSNGLPDLSTDVIIDGNYATAINGEFNAQNLDVTLNGSLTISENTTITVQLNVANLGVFNIEDTATLLMIDPTGTASGSFIVKRNTPDYPTADINSFYSSPLIDH